MQVESGPFFYQVLKDRSLHTCSAASFSSELVHGGHVYEEGDLLEGSLRVAAEGTHFVMLDSMNNEHQLSNCWVYETRSGEPVLKELLCTKEQFDTCMQAATLDFSPRAAQANPSLSQRLEHVL